MGCSYSAIQSEFMGLAEVHHWSFSQCSHYEVHGASQQWGFMINYRQDELLIDMSLETRGRYFTVTVSPLCIFPSFELDTDQLRANLGCVPRASIRPEGHRVYLL
jgi:hypothetical protein